MNRPDASPAPSARRVRRGFDRAARTYDEAAVLQARVGEELLERIDELRLAPRRVLDVGAGTGRITRALRSRFRRAMVIGLDPSPGMLAIARERQGWFARHALVCADAQRLPLAPGSMELATSNLALHWAADLDAALAELARVLAEGATLCLSMPGPDTLGELRAAYATVDDQAHVNRFLDMHDVGDALARAGFRDPVLDVERHTVTYGALTGLFADLKATGATALCAPAAGLTGTGRRRRLVEAYEAYRQAGRLPATAEIIYARALRGPARHFAGDTDEVVVPLSGIRRRR